MDTVTIRELRNHGGRVLERIARGESLTVTLDGRPVAELRPIRATGVSAATLLNRRQNLPHIDPERFRSDIDRALDASL
jgi:prevent-host-death family protein